MTCLQFITCNLIPPKGNSHGFGIGMQRLVLGLVVEVQEELPGTSGATSGRAGQISREGLGRGTRGWRWDSVLKKRQDLAEISYGLGGGGGDRECSSPASDSSSRVQRVWPQTGSGTAACRAEGAVPSLCL